MLIMEQRKRALPHLDQQRDRAGFVHFQDFTILRPHEYVAMAEGYGTYGGIVLQKQTCRTDRTNGMALAQV